MKSIALIAALASTAFAHMQMDDPPAFKSKNNPNAGQDIDYSRTAPLASMAQFPCKGYHSLLGSPAGKPTASYTPGQSSSITISGGANHGGGSCQISLSYDQGKSWTVIKSVIGSCPGAGTTKIPFTVPDDAPAGVAILAWSWSNKIGNREFYMDCAPVQVGGSKKRSELAERRVAIQQEKRATAYSARPGIFVANLGNGCNVAEGTDVVYPNPGPDVEKGSGNLQPPSPAGCGGAGSGAAPPSDDQPTTTKTPVAPTTTKAPGQSPPAAPTTVPGGVFVTKKPDEPTPTPSPTGAPAEPSKKPAEPTKSTPTKPATPSGTGAPAPPVSQPGSGGAPGTACSQEGAWNCIGGTSFSRCASGTWSAIIPMAAGTSCKAGVSANLEMTASSRRFRRARAN